MWRYVCRTLEKRFYYGGKSYEIKWFSHGTGGRKMKVMSTVAWMEYLRNIKENKIYEKESNCTNSLYGCYDISYFMLWEKGESRNEMFAVQDNWEYDIVYDKETKVMYTYSKGGDG